MVNLNSLFIKKLQTVKLYNFNFSIDLNIINEDIALVYDLNPVQLKKALYVIYKSLDESISEKYSFKRLDNKEGIAINYSYSFTDKENYTATVNAYKQLENNIEAILLNNKEFIKNDDSEFKQYVHETIHSLVSPSQLKNTQSEDKPDELKSLQTLHLEHKIQGF